MELCGWSLYFVAKTNIGKRHGLRRFGNKPMTRSCQWIVDWHRDSGRDGDPIFCDRPASIKWKQEWFCADHYDELLSKPQSTELSTY